ncbi:MAG: hypothetical protein H7Y01_01735 [Ferruginibacter sp.]|nr:hypothetical protein [Chitinophagaceae bacterium]
MKRQAGIVIALILSLSAGAQGQQDKVIINKLCGCFDIEFKYAETFSPDPEYKYHERDETSGGVELSLPIEVTEKKIIIQHLLVITDSIIVKHWREEWTYENPVIWKYKGDRTWVKEQLSPEQVKGKWTQTIWEVSDEPRYQGFSQFVTLDGKITWQNTTDAPLPRREYSVRSDYNILRRTNRLYITDSGYIHEQDNEKIIRTNNTDKLLTQEKGINSYKRLDDKKCAAAKYYWEKNKVYWEKVRQAWAAYLGNGQTVISLSALVDGKRLHEYLFSLSKEYAAKKISDAAIDSLIKTQIDKFILLPDKPVKP